MRSLLNPIGIQVLFCEVSLAGWLFVVAPWENAAWLANAAPNRASEANASLNCLVKVSTRSLLLYV